MICLRDQAVRELGIVLLEACWVACWVTLDLIVLLGILGVTLVDYCNISSWRFSSLGWSSRISSAVTQLVSWKSQVFATQLAIFNLYEIWSRCFMMFLTIVPGTHFLSPCVGMMRTGSVGYKGNSSLFLNLMSKLAFCLSLIDCKLCFIRSRFWTFGR